MIALQAFFIKGVIYVKLGNQLFSDRYTGDSGELEPVLSTEIPEWLKQLMEAR